MMNSDPPSNPFGKAAVAFSKGVDRVRGYLNTIPRTPEPKYIDVTLYVRARHFVTPSVDDAFELALILNTYPMYSFGVERPTEPCISQSQYDRLPETLKGFFAPKPMKIKRI